jgi:hypothetical protein
MPTFKGVGSTGAHVALVPRRATRPGQAPQHPRRAAGSPARQAPGSWASWLWRLARAAPA